MTGHMEPARRPALPPRSRKRWAVAGGVAACWAVLLVVTGSGSGATAVLAVFGVLGVVSVLGLRALGVTRDHPWVQRLVARPWRDGQDVLQLALRHLPDVFVVTPSGSRLAPEIVELQLNPDDLCSLRERIDLGLIAESATEVYEEQVAAHGARFAGPGPARVNVIAGASVPPGRYRLRQGQPVNVGPPAGYPIAPLAPPAGEFRPAGPALAYAVPQPARSPAYGPAYSPAYGAAQPAGRKSPYQDYEIHDGRTSAEPARAAVSEWSTVMEPRRDSIPVLRLVTGDSVAETTMSGARAGRGDVELRLPHVPTVSRAHASFTFSGGQWWIANLGMNGLTVNGVPVAGECPLSSGDSIRWGTKPDALQSMVEIARTTG
jgi:FHA domain